MSFKNVPQQRLTPTSTVNAFVRFAFVLRAWALTLANKVHGIRPRLEQRIDAIPTVAQLRAEREAEQRAAVQEAQRIVRMTRAT